MSQQFKLAGILALFGLALTAGSIAQAAVAGAQLTTLAEQSHFLRTGRYDEVERLCPAFAARWAQQVRCFSFGTTPEGRPMLALAVSADGAMSASRSRAQHRPVILFQGGIHAGEIDGKDAGFLALRELLEGSAARESLKKVTLLFVPVFNIDGHERFGAWNRPNQIGPEQMGWRTTAQNLNLNRDYTKADAPEMQAMLNLLNEWDPVVYVDMHVTDGANFEHDVSVTVGPAEDGDAGVAKLAAGIRDAVNAKLSTQGSLPLAFYPSFEKDDDPASGFSLRPSSPRYSTGYWGLRNRVAILLETHSWKDYATRVRITHNFIVDLMELARDQASEWQRIAKTADEAASLLAGSTVPLDFENTKNGNPIDFRGYEYERTMSPVSGGLVTRYDTSKPAIWHVPLYTEVRSKLDIPAPRAGYVVPAAYAGWLAPKLRGHAIRFELVAAARPAAAVQSFRASKVTIARETFEGHAEMKVTGAWNADTRDVPAGSLFVPIAQPNARLVMALLEPQAPDSYVDWGFFNSAFEQKEYAEPYVAEQMGKEMLEKDPALKAEFVQKLAADPQFASDPKARLDFFYKRHASWDERMNLYPVYRVDGWK